MSRWSVGSSNISTFGAGYHHLGQHAAHLLTSGKDLHLLYSVLAGKQHTAQETADIVVTSFLRRILGQPLYDSIVIVKLSAVVLGKIRLGGGKTPLIATLVGSISPDRILKRTVLARSFGPTRATLSSLPRMKGNIVQNLFAVNGLA